MTRGEGAGQELALPGMPAIEKRKPGRPKGSTAKASTDFHRWLQAMYPGLTPAQQSAMVALVTPKEVRAAKGSVLGAMATKAKDLAEAMGIKTAEAWRFMAVERAQLLAFAHPRLAQVDVTTGGEQLLPMIILPDAPAQQNQGVIDFDLIEVAPLKSYDTDKGE